VGDRFGGRDQRRAVRPYRPTASARNLEMHRWPFSSEHLVPALPFSST
jgi:hypothetical protein